MLVAKNYPQWYKEHVILFITFPFGEGITIIYLDGNIKLYLYNIDILYKDTIIGNMGNSGTVDLLLHVVYCWLACAVNKENQAITFVL